MRLNHWRHGVDVVAPPGLGLRAIRQEGAQQPLKFGEAELERRIVASRKITVQRVVLAHSKSLQCRDAHLSLLGLDFEIDGCVVRRVGADALGAATVRSLRLSHVVDVVAGDGRVRFEMLRPRMKGGGGRDQLHLTLLSIVGLEIALPLWIMGVMNVRLAAAARGLAMSAETVPVVVIL